MRIGNGGRRTRIREKLTVPRKIGPGIRVGIY